MLKYQLLHFYFYFYFYYIIILQKQAQRLVVSQRKRVEEPRVGYVVRPKF